MAKISEKNQVTSEELTGILKQADFLANCFQEKCQTVLRLTSASKNEDEVGH